MPRSAPTISGRLHTIQLATPHTNAANGTTVAWVNGIAPTTLVATTKLAAPSSPPTTIDTMRGGCTSFVAAR
jgi:hypothetical protein